MIQKKIKELEREIKRKGNIIININGKKRIGISSMGIKMQKLLGGKDDN